MEEFEELNFDVWDDSYITGYESGSDFYSYDEELFTTMLGATQLGDIESLKAIRNAERTEFTQLLRSQGGRLIFEAVRCGQYDAGDFLLCNGCSTEKCAEMKSSALHVAAGDPKATQFLERLILYHRNVNCKDAVDNTPLHYACTSGLDLHVDILLRNGANSSNMNSVSQTPLHIAAVKGHVNCVKLLLDSDSLVNARDSEEPMNRTPLDSAVMSLFTVLGHKNVALAVNAFLNWNSPRMDEIIEILESQMIVDSTESANSNETVYMSVVKPRLQIIDLLIEKSAKFDILIFVSKYLSHDYLFEVLDKLIAQSGVNVNARDHLNYTPLHFLVMRSYTKMAEYIIDRGADVNALSYTMISPLEIALKERVGEDVVKLLVRKGARVNCMTSLGWSPLTLALKFNNVAIAEFLLNCGADPNFRHLRDNPGFSPIMVLLNQTPLNVKAIKCLLEHGADVNVQDTTPLEFTPLHMAAKCESRNEVVGVEVMKLLLKQGGDVNMRDAHGYTPLMRAITVRYHSLALIRVLLKAGADPNVRGGDGLTALHHAIRSSKADVITLLMEYEQDFHQKDLFDDRATIMATISMNLPYSPAELFIIRGFHFREDIVKERKKMVDNYMEKSIRSTFGQEFYECLACCLYESLRDSPLERSCLSSLTCGPAVLFGEVENYILKTAASRDTDETLLRGVLEYRMCVADTDSYKSACSREIALMKTHMILGELTVADVFSSDVRRLLWLMRKYDVFQELSSNVDSLSDEIRYPIFGVVLKNHIRNGLVRRELLNSASYFMNIFFSRRNNTTSTTFNPHDSFSSLPAHVLENILGYLSNKDLINFIIFVSNTQLGFIKGLKKSWRKRFLTVLNSDKGLTGDARHPSCAEADKRNMGRRCRKLRSLLHEEHSGF